MIRPLITFALLFKRQALVLFLLLAVLCAVVAITPWYLGLLGFGIGLLRSVTLQSVRVRPKRFRLGRFAWHVRRFRSIREGRITLHFPPELADQWDLPLVLSCCRQEFEQLARTFADVRLRHGHVYLFATSREISKVFERPSGGFALPNAKIIVIANDGFLRETIRHELVHLFSGRWNLQPPSILREGLAVHLQGSEYGQPLDVHTCYHLDRKDRGVASLLDETTFLRKNQIHANYVLAGSFTGFLIRRFGWDKYRDIYRKSTVKDFEATFQKCFLLTLQEAELQWRRELLVTSALFRGIKKHAQTQQ